MADFRLRLQAQAQSQLFAQMIIGLGTSPSWSFEPGKAFFHVRSANQESEIGGQIEARHLDSRDGLDLRLRFGVRKVPETRRQFFRYHIILCNINNLVTAWCRLLDSNQWPHHYE